MIHTPDRDTLRQQFNDIWQAYLNKTPLPPDQITVAKIIEEHPEYHVQLSKLDKDYLPENGEANPYLHLSLHVSLREQISIDRPSGICNIAQSLQRKGLEQHDIEHQMMEVLAHEMWRAMREGTEFDEKAYVEKLQGLVSD